jgi:hypothetical protein
LVAYSAVGAVAILLVGAVLVMARQASTNSLDPSLRGSQRGRSGLREAEIVTNGVGLAQAHRAYVRRPASLDPHRLVAGPTSAPIAGQPGEGDQPSPPIESVLAPQLEAASPPSMTLPPPPPSASSPPPPEVSPPVIVAPEPEPEPTPPAILQASFESGLKGWSTAGAGNVVPKVTSDIVRTGGSAGAVVLTGTQGRSELILGGNGGPSTAEAIQFHEGDEYWYGFSFYIETMVYGAPGAHNLIMQFKSDDEGSPAFGLQLWDYAGDNGEYAEEPKGLWSTGEAMDGDRFLAPVAEHQWHDVQIHFKASSVGAGFYEIFVDGQLVDARNAVSMIVPGASYAYIKNGLYRNGEEIPGTSELRLDAAKLGDTLESVRP